ncbi:TRAP transporter large permease [Pelobacter seleniigenes]|uniref:TRAP transporter large permease n=1 Tax=Pelobacter seleniigenes TaxID=407188 RepID=UPI0004A6B5D0|nr:TRAP transporter large permease [Pelobacter seleniigenes]
MTLLLLSLTVLLLLGIPIAYALGLSGYIYFLVDQPLLLAILPQRLYSGMESYSMIALPLFCLMGYLMNAGGITARLIDFSLLFVGRFRGGLGLVNVLSSMIFGGISGSSVSDTASVGAILIPEMQKKGYSVEYSSGITVASSTMGMIIPPSVPMIIYALAAEQSVGRLFLASAIPGILIGILMLVITLVISYRKKLPREAAQLSTTEKKKCLQRAILALIMPIFVIGSIVLGVATATEAAAIGVLYSLLVGFFVFKTLRLRDIPELAQKAIITSANVMIIIAFSKLYIWILALERVPQMLANGVMNLGLPTSAVFIAVILIILVCGTFIDVSPAILLLTPVFLPLVAAFGMDGIQFGVILITGLAVGLVTPPVGMCLNVASAISKLEIGAIFTAALPFLAANLLTLLLIAFVPALTHWLPSLLMP